MSVLYFPIWISIFIAIVGMFYFPIFWEAVLILFISDLIFGVSESKLFGFKLATILIALILIIPIEFLKKKLKFYNK